MSMFRKQTKEEKREFEVGNIYVVKTETVSSYNNGKGYGPLCATQFFLATRCDEDDSIRELFSGVAIEPLRNIQSFDKPYAVETTKLTEYMKNPNTKTLTAEDLFGFIVSLNTDEIVHTYSELEDEYEDEGEEDDGKE